MQTYALKRQEAIKPATDAGQPAGQAPVKRLRLVTVAEGLPWAEAKRRRAADRTLTIVPERTVDAA